MYDNIAFGEELKEIREKKGYSITKMSCMIDSSTDQVKRIEDGANVGIRTMSKYLEAIGLDINDVFKE